jgi:hypothetical protein
MSLVEQHPLEHTEEVDQVVWLSPEDAISRLSYALERELLERVFSPRAPQS